MNRRDFIKLSLSIGASSLLGNILYQHPISAFPLSGRDYHRIVVVADPHYPIKPKHFVTPAVDKIIEGKRQAAADISSWDDVDLVAVVGDLVPSNGTAEEYTEAVGYISSIGKPLAVVAGNHDVVYSDDMVNSKLQRGTPLERQLKLDRFKAAFSLDDVYYCRRAGNCLLIFMSPDKIDSDYLCEISQKQLNWLDKTLRENATVPTIIFFHAPLLGALAKYNSSIDTPGFVAQPVSAIDQIIKNNPQVILWVSGHTHTPATNPSFCSPINLYRNQVWNIHNSDMERRTVWTNSLYLYPDHITVKTYNHRTAQFEEALTREISLTGKLLNTPGSL